MTQVRPFISYAREDAEVARRLYHDLRLSGANPWLDTEDLIGGKPWDIGIRNAIHSSSHFIALLSAHSINKRGYVQKEVRQALEVLATLPPNDVYVIPVRLDQSTPQHERLKELHWVDLFPNYRAGFTKLCTALQLSPKFGKQRKRQDDGVGSKRRQPKHRTSRSRKWCLPPDPQVRLVLEWSPKMELRLGVRNDSAALLRNVRLLVEGGSLHPVLIEFDEIATQSQSELVTLREVAAMRFDNDAEFENAYLLNAELRRLFEGKAGPKETHIIKFAYDDEDDRAHGVSIKLAFERRNNQRKVAPFLQKHTPLKLKQL